MADRSDGGGVDPELAAGRRGGQIAADPDLLDVVRDSFSAGSAADVMEDASGSESGPEPRKE